MHFLIFKSSNFQIYKSENMSLTFALIAFNVVITLYAWRNQDFLESWVFHPYSVKRNYQWYRFLTSGFLHADWGHLFFNMFSLYFFGEAVEGLFKGYFGPQMGSLWFLALFVTGVILSDVPTYFKYKNDRNYHSLGASGGVSTIIFASILYYPLNNICLYGIFCLPGVVMGVLYLIYSYFEAKKNRDNVNHDAHFYGAVIGIIMGWILIPEAGGLFLSQILERLPF
jgi:membrane associated rhomboid family serine protease